MKLHDLADALGIQYKSLRIRCRRAGIPIVNGEVDSLQAADMLNRTKKECPECHVWHVRKRFCSSECRYAYSNKYRTMRARLHPLQSVKIAGIKGEDRRVRLSPEEREEIRYKHKQGGSLHGLAREYGVDRRCIQFVVFPERYEHAKKLSRERHSEGRYEYGKEHHRVEMAQHRKHKRKLLEEKGVL